MKTIFRSGATSFLPVLGWCLLALVCLAADTRFASFHAVRNQAERLVFPVRWLVDTPIRLLRWVETSVSSKQKLIVDNASLRAQQLLLQSKLHQMVLLQRENAQLKQLLQSTARIQGKVAEAQLLSIDLSPALHQIVLNKGKSSGVYMGQPVLDAYGVLGQVIGLSAGTSKVLLVSDARFALPVQDQRSGVRAIAVGSGSSQRMSLINTVHSEAIKRGDLFITSGLGLRFPVGYPVGRVVSVHPSPEGHQQQVQLAIAAHLDKTTQMLLAWPDREVQQQAVQHLLPPASEVKYVN